jgi:hypothetical protein
MVLKSALRITGKFLSVAVITAATLFGLRRQPDPEPLQG